MKSLRIGYQPYSHDLSHPGDRRRIAFWAKNRGHSITTDLNEPVDVIVLSERADLGAFPKKANGVPLIFDLVDAYLLRENLLHDWLRGTSKVLTGQLSGAPKPFTKFVKDLCASASAVICSSPEQLKAISIYSNNVHVILDSHDEFPMLPFDIKPIHGPRRVLWEGMPATLAGIRQIVPALTATRRALDIELNFVTDPKYFRLLGKYFELETSALLKHALGHQYEHSEIIPWSKENLVSAAMKSELAIIPINLSSPMQYLKPENRLLIMWRLGLPCVTSPSPAYIRVSKAANVAAVCYSTDDWTEKINQILGNVDLAEDIVSSGQSYLKKNHSGEMILEKWDAAIASVV